MGAELVLAVAVLVLAVALTTVLLRQRRHGLGVEQNTLSSSAIEPTAGAEPVIRAEDVGRGGFRLIVADEVLATLELAPDSLPVSSDDVANASVTAGVVELARAVPHVAKAMQSSGFRITFSKDTMRGLADGSLKFMGGYRGVAVDGTTARFHEIGKVTGSAAGKLATSWPALLSGGVAVAAAAQQQHQLDAALNEINAGIEDLHQRHIDDDAGALLAAAQLAASVLSACADGRIPPQIAQEVAIARREVEAIYFARRQGVRRFISAIEAAQNEHEAAKGEALAWPSGVEKAFGDAQRFHADTLAFVQAATVKAHLAASTAAVVASDGDAGYAFDLLDETEELLRRDVLELQRRLFAMVSNSPQGLRNRGDRRTAHQVVTRLVAALDQHIAPLLPLDRNRAISVHVSGELGAAAGHDRVR